MYQQLAAAVDAIHAIFMIVQVAGLPLLFVHRWPRLTFAYGVYAITFIVMSQGSQYLLGECFLTTLARWLWKLGAAHSVDPSSEWFTVRFAEAIFHLTPSHRSVTIASEALILITAMGIIMTIRRGRARKSEDLSPSSPARP